MISKERLQELIEQEETVWCVSELWGSNQLKLHNKDVRDSDCFHISKTLLLSDSIEFYDEEETYRVPFQLLFETQREYLKHQEEAEFIAKYHTTKTYKFEPPTWKEFLATKKHEDMFAHWSCGDICVVMVEENNEKGILKTYNQFEVDIFNDYDSKSRKFDYCIIQSYGIDTRELFLGNE